ncbi:MAG: hypothetical protein GYB65_13525, partial [Chloroflexi bacterium]|nr:hypothetical protein [Chloroflexota bacterium]
MLAAMLIPLSPSRAQSSDDRVLYENTYTLPVMHDSTTSGITGPTGDEVDFTVRVSGPREIPTGMTLNLTVEFLTPNYDGSDNTQTWDIGQASIALVLPDDRMELADIASQDILINNGGNTTWQRAQPPTELESVWLPAGGFLFTQVLMAGLGFIPIVGDILTTGDVLIGAQDALATLQEGQPLSDQQLREYYWFENQYDLYDIPDYVGQGGTRGERTVKRYILPLRVERLDTVLIYVNGVRIMNATPNAMGPGDFHVFADLEQQVVITLPLAEFYPDSVPESDTALDDGAPPANGSVPQTAYEFSGSNADWTPVVR